jgi:cell wall-associated NlpC family hydrolase
MGSNSFAIRALAGLAFAAASSGCALSTEDSAGDGALGDEEVIEVGQAATTCTAAASFTFQKSGDITTAYLNGTAVAWFTAGARTVTMAGPSRTYTWGSPVAVTVKTTTWVRTMGSPFDPTMSESSLTSWLNAARAVNCSTTLGGSLDLVSIGMQYVDGATKDAAYGMGADFYDFLGINWQPLDASLQLPDLLQLGNVDCSGFMRLLFGYRTNFTYAGTSTKIPLSIHATTNAMPRSSQEIYQYGPGKLLVPFRVQPAGSTTPDGGSPTDAELALMQPGDLVFFDTNCDYSVSNPICGTDASAISHVGMYIGKDTDGNYRYLSSRSSTDGPTIGNANGWSVFNKNSASGYYPPRFRAARRL